MSYNVFDYIKVNRPKILILAGVRIAYFRASSAIFETVSVGATYDVLNQLISMYLGSVMLYKILIPCQLECGDLKKRKFD